MKAGGRGGGPGDGCSLTKPIFKQWPFTQAAPGLLDITGSGFIAQVYLHMI